MSAPVEVDALVCARWIVPVEPHGVTLENHAIAIKDGRIEALLPTLEAHLRYLPGRVHDLGEHLLIPGLINLHSHAAMTLMRGIADDMPLMRWLNEAIWPRERRHVGAEFVYEGTLLGGAEMLRGGITCTNDMYFFPEASARAFTELGMRAVVGLPVMEFPTAYAADAADYIRKGLAVRDEWRDNGLIRFAFAPHAPYSVSDATFEQVASLAQELDALVHTHLHETRDEIDESLQKHGVRPLARLQRLGLLGPNLTIAHGVHLTEGEIETLAAHAVTVAHNPTSNMKLASGIAPVRPLLAAGCNVGLGTDSACSNNRQDLLQEMRQASLLAKVCTGDPTAVPAHAALHMATLAAARALGIEGIAGSLVPGKDADIVALKLDGTETAPCFDATSHLLYVAGREHVSHVWLRGKEMLQSGVLLHPNNTDLKRISDRWENSLKNQAGHVT